METSTPKTICCGVPVVWMLCPKSREEIWAARCLWCGRMFAYTDTGM